MQILREAADRKIFDHEDISMSIIEGRREAFDKEICKSLERLESGLESGHISKKDRVILSMAIKKGILKKADMADIVKAYEDKKLERVLRRVAGGGATPSDMKFLRREIEKEKVDPEDINIVVAMGNKQKREDNSGDGHYFM